MKIDTHQHFWQYNQQDYGWMLPGMEILKKDHLPDDLRPLLQSISFDGSVAVQARQNLEETEWLLQLADYHAIIKGVVGWVDLRSPELSDQLQCFGPHPKLCGVRHVVHDEPDDQFMLREEFVRGIRLLADFNLTYDLLLFPKHLPVACELVEKFPDQPFVLDHIAKPFIKDGQISPWDEDIRRLAAFPNVYCKVSGMVTEADWKAWQPADFRPYLDIILKAFGSKRLMLGSDWPVCTVAGTYAEVMQLGLKFIDQLSETEQADILGNNAFHFYGLAGDEARQNNKLPR
jgi:L-fuconolactonase